MKIVFLATLIVAILLVPAVFAVNIDFSTAVPGRIFYPNETIPLNITIINRAVSSSITNTSLTCTIGRRIFTFNVGVLKPSEERSELVMLPEQVPSDYIIKSQLNYTGFFGEGDILETYSSFKVRFPEMERMPRNILITGISVPDNVIEGQSQSLLITISNDGQVSGDMEVELAILETKVTKRFTLRPSETKTLEINTKFDHPGLVPVDAKAYAIVDGIKYLVAYEYASVYVKENKVARIEFDGYELIDETDNEINQIDNVTMRVYLFNNGSWLASDVNVLLKSSSEKIKIYLSDNGLKTITAGAVQYFDFLISTQNVEQGVRDLVLEATYTDSGANKEYSFPFQIDIAEEKIPPCTSNSDCEDGELCSNSNCIILECVCGYPVNHGCNRYSCCSDLDCEEGYSCDHEKDACIPSKSIETDVLIITASDLEVTGNLKSSLNKYRKVLLDRGLKSFFIEVDSPKVEEIFSTEPADTKNWKSVKRVIDKIVYKTTPKYIIILGGTEKLPQPPAKTDEGIPTIPPSDDRYSDFDQDGVPDFSIARIPISDPKELSEYFEKLTAMQNEIQLKKKIIIGDACGGNGCFLKKDIEYVSGFVFGNDCGDSEYCLNSPPYCTATGSPPIYPIPCSEKNKMTNYIKSSDFIFFGAHGNGNEFVSIEDDSGLIADLIVSGRQIYNDFDFSEKVIFTFACFGGSIDVSSICVAPGACAYPKLVPQDSTALASIYKKAAIFIGNTRYGYGGQTSAKLFKDIYEGMKQGKSVGEAVLDMKRKRLASYNCEWYKAVVYEVQLYGDPTLKVIGG